MKNEMSGANDHRELKKGGMGMAIGQKGWPGHYLSAYGIAQKRGFRGTEQEWLQSLHGADVEMQTEDGLLQWKKENDADWKTLASFSDFTDGAVSRAEAAAREVMGEAVKNANEKAARAETAAGSADASAGKADAATDRANTAKAGADNAAQNAGERAGEARQSATAANSAATAANDAAAAANGAAGTANSAAETARAQGDYAEAQGDVAKELTDKLKETDIGGMAADILALQSGKVDKASAAKRTCRFVVGTSTAGWTENDCDYLCDGVDDQVEINAALQALPEGGGEVKILDGTYCVSAPILMNRDNMTLRGNYPATVLQRCWNSSLQEGLIHIMSYGCSVRELTIDGNADNYSEVNNFCIYVGQARNVIADNRCSNCRNGIILLSAKNSIVKNNICSGGLYGIYMKSCENNTLEGNEILVNEAIGICLNSSDNNRLIGNSCDRGNIGINLSTSSYNTLSANTCTEGEAGIYLRQTEHCNMIGNICTNNLSESISLNKCKNLAATGNITDDCYWGFSINELKDSTVTGNACCNNDYGIQMSASQNNIIGENICHRGTGLSSDYNVNQFTIYFTGTENNNNLISNNMIMGKNYVCEGGTGNEFVNNKFE